jgi:hypothetical protein
MSDSSSDTSISGTAPPSRCDNPFATCWVRPGALAFKFPAPLTAEELVDTLAERKWRGAIVGPHGSGKTTLLETLKPVLEAAGRRLRVITLRDEQQPLLADFRARVAEISNCESRQTECTRSPGQLLFMVDGYEQLGWLTRLRLHRMCRRSGAGLLVTAHDPCSIPTLIQLAPALNLVEQLVGDLCSRVSTPITNSHVAASHACHGSNVREIFFALYDQHERLRRGA